MMRMYRTSVTFLSLTAAVGLALTVSACWLNTGDWRYMASGSAVTAPALGTEFVEFVSTSRQRIESVVSRRLEQDSQAFGGDYDLPDILDIRSPYQILPDSARCVPSSSTPEQGRGVGFLMVHGLSDGAYLLRDIAAFLHQQFPCAVIHGLLLPGHGTIPGDLVDVQHEQWQDAVRYGMTSFGADVHTVIPVAYSMGAALVLRDYAERLPSEHPSAAAVDIAALVLLSPGLSARTTNALLPLTVWIRRILPWLDQYDDRDAAKYESLAINAIAEFYLLTEPFQGKDSPHVDIPVFMVASAQDQTEDAHFIRRYYCRSLTSPLRQLIWYYHPDIPANDDSVPNCEGITEKESSSLVNRTLAIAHTAITVRPENPHYGLDGVYRQCLHEKGSDARYQECLTNPQALYDEPGSDSAVKHSLAPRRRGTFQPHWQDMMDRMILFLRMTLWESNRSLSP